MNTHLVIPDPHAHPDYDNSRADLLGKLIADLRPNVVVNLGDMFDMPSLCEYDRGKKSFQGRKYSKDIEAGLDFDDRLWYYIRKNKKRLPYSIFLEGNHENRIKKAVNLQPELEDTIGFDDLGLYKNYDKVVEYEGGTPGVTCIDGVNYAHYFISGLMGRPVGGEHHAKSLINKQHESCTAGHSHSADFAMSTSPSGKKIMGLVAGVYQDYWAEWAGEQNKLWWRGVVIKRNVKDGEYDPEFVSLERLKKEYS